MNDFNPSYTEKPPDATRRIFPQLMQITTAVNCVYLANKRASALSFRFTLQFVFESVTVSVRQREVGEGEEVSRPDP